MSTQIPTIFYYLLHPSDWHKVGTDYLFVDDKLHSYGRSLFSFGFDEASGKYLNGAYKSYVLGDFEWWLQVYNHVYQQNPFDIYPAAKKAFSSELLDSLPNGYSSNYVTLGDTKWLYHKSFMNLYDDQDKILLCSNSMKIWKNQQSCPTPGYQVQMVRMAFCTVSMETIIRYREPRRAPRAIWIKMRYFRCSGKTGIPMQTGSLW